jgi:hypothetical protein
VAATVADADGDWATVKGINNMRLQNTVMQLRKACSHPLLFSDPTELLPETTEELVDASGKMMLLERLLDELFRTKHKVLLFSQFTTMLDIIEVCVLGISPSSRTSLMHSALMTDLGDRSQGVADLPYRWVDEPAGASRADEFVPESGGQGGCAGLVLVEYACRRVGDYIDGCRYGHFL